MLLYFSSQTYKYVLGVGNKLYLVTGKHYYQKDLQTATCHTMQRRQVEEEGLSRCLRWHLKPSEVAFNSIHLAVGGEDLTESPVHTRWAVSELHLSPCITFIGQYKYSSRVLDNVEEKSKGLTEKQRWSKFQGGMVEHQGGEGKRDVRSSPLWVPCCPGKFFSETPHCPIQTNPSTYSTAGW